MLQKQGSDANMQQTTLLQNYGGIERHTADIKQSPCISFLPLFRRWVVFLCALPLPCFFTFCRFILTLNELKFIRRTSSHQMQNLLRFLLQGHANLCKFIQVHAAIVLAYYCYFLYSLSINKFVLSGPVLKQIC